MTRYPTPGAGVSNSETENALFESMFARFGVSQYQFRELLASGEKFKVTKGVYLVNGGEVNTKVVLIIKGWAIAYKHGQGAFQGMSSVSSVSDPLDLPHVDSEGNLLGEPVCQYCGKLESDKEAASAQHIKGLLLPTRASVIGGSALVDKDVVLRPYPNDVVAATNLEYIQWEVDDLNRVVDAPKWRALQASIYYWLYVDLIGTLDRDRAISMMTKDKTATKKAVRPPTNKQLRSLAIFVAVPFFGFGFADNAIMLVCGDFIDSTFGAALGLSTLAAAGLGNWVSDAVGLGLGDAIEQQAARLGLSNGNLKPAQEKLPVARLTTTFSKLLGISLGCLAGMTPLLFMSSNKKEFTKEDLELYDALFAPNGVSTSDFDKLMEKATRKKLPALSQMVVGGEDMPKVMLLLRGEALAYGKQDPDQPIHKYTGSFEDAGGGDKPDGDDDRWVTSHGAVIGGSAMVNPTLRKSAYPNDIWSTSPVEWIEWDLDYLLEIMKEANPLQASFYSVLYVALVKNLEKDRPVKELEVYRAVLSAVLADGYLDAKEADYLWQTRKALNISEYDHFEVLADIGWSRQRWEVNLTTAQGPPPPQRTFMESVSKIEQELQNLRNVVNIATDAASA